MTFEYRQTMLKAEDIDLTLGGRKILRDVDLEIKNIHRPGLTQGQVVGLLGPSGMGKTRLFRILAGLDEPDSGTVTLENGEPVERGRVGVVFQHYPLLDHRTVLGNLAVAARQAGTPRGEAEEKSMAMLERFGLTEHAKKYPAQLSGGQRQRVAIAQQFMCSDHFLLMDEPFSGLDPIAIRKVTEFICEMAASDELKTIIVVTHDIEAAVEVSDQIWLLGRDHDASGEPIPGARVQMQINLAERGLAWRKGISTTAEFLGVTQEIREVFPKL